MGLDFPDYDDLVAYASNSLDAHAHTRIASLVRDDAEIAGRLQRITAMLACFASYVDVAPSQKALREAIALAGGAGLVEELLATLRRASAQALALLSYDSRTQPALGLRGPSSIYQIAYEGELADIDLELQQQADESWLLHGRVTAHQADAPERVVIAKCGSKSPGAVIELGERGAFRTELAADRYELFVQAGQKAMRIQELDLSNTQ